MEFTKREEELKELLGHQPIEVLGGSIFGIVLGLISAKIENDSRRKKTAALKRTQPGTRTFRRQ